MKCSDCPTEVPEKVMGKVAIARGSSVREPGEALCGGCRSRRVMLVRELDKLPNTLDQIKALRCPKVGQVA